MKTARTNQYIEFSASESRGEYCVRVFRDGSQLQIEVGDDFPDEIYIDTDMRELLAIRNAIDEAIGCANRDTCCYYNDTAGNDRYCLRHKGCFVASTTNNK